VFNAFPVCALFNMECVVDMGAENFFLFTVCLSLISSILNQTRTILTLFVVFGAFTVCALFNMECVVYMGAEDVKRQSLNVFRMKMLGATVVRKQHDHTLL